MKMIITKSYRPYFFLIILFQLGLSHSYSQAVDKGDMIIDAYVGWPNVGTALLESAYMDDPYFTNNDLVVSGTPSIGGRFEYVLSRYIGIGLNVNYANSKVRTTITEQEVDPKTGNFIDVDYNYIGSYPRLRFIPTVLFHFSRNSRIDFYTSVGAGYCSTQLKEETNDPKYKSDGNLSILDIPVAFRMEVGARFFISKNVGMNMQSGFFGGPLFAAGLCTKF
jgi:hypothetical protein